MLFAGGYTMLVRRFVCLITKNYKFFGCNYSLTKLPTFGQPSWEESRSTLNPLPDNQKSHYTVSTNQWRFAICWQRGETGRLQFPTVSVFLCLSAQASSVTTTWTIESRFENPTWRSWTSCWLIAEHACYSAMIIWFEFSSYALQTELPRSTLPQGQCFTPTTQLAWRVSHSHTFQGRLWQLAITISLSWKFATQSQRAKGLRLEAKNSGFALEIEGMALGTMSYWCMCQWSRGTVVAYHRWAQRSFWVTKCRLILVFSSTCQR